MKQFRQKSVVVWAEQWTGTPEAGQTLIDWVTQNGGNAKFQGTKREVIQLTTVRGVKEVSPGDWIIQGDQGDFKTVTDTEFIATHDTADAVELMQDCSISEQGHNFEHGDEGIWCMNCGLVIEEPVVQQLPEPLKEEESNDEEDSSNSQQ